MAKLMGKITAKAKRAAVEAYEKVGSTVKQTIREIRGRDQ